MTNLVPRVLRLFDQRVGARRDSGELEFQLPQDFCDKTMQAVTGQPKEKKNFLEFPRVSPGEHPLAKEPEDSGYEMEK